VLEAEEAAELTELDVSEALFDKELATEDEAELRALDALDAPFEPSLLPDEADEIAASDKLEAEPEMTDAADLTLLAAFSATPGSSPTIEDDALADRLLTLSLATDVTLSTLPCCVPMTELDA